MDLSNRGDAGHSAPAAGRAKIKKNIERSSATEHPALVTPIPYIGQGLDLAICSFISAPRRAGR